MERLTTNKSSSFIASINWSSITIYCTGFVEHRYSHGGDPITFHKSGVNDCKHCYMEMFRLQHIETECLVKY